MIEAGGCERNGSRVRTGAWGGCEGSEDVNEKFVARAGKWIEGRRENDIGGEN